MKKTMTLQSLMSIAILTQCSV